MTGRPVPGWAPMSTPFTGVCADTVSGGYVPPNSRTTLSTVAPLTAVATVHGWARVHGAPLVPLGDA